MWFDQIAEIIAQFLMKSKNLKKLEIITVNDCNRALTAVFEALHHNRSIMHLRVAINTLNQESILFLLKVIRENKRIEALDLSYEAMKEIRHIAAKGNIMNKKNENFGVKCLESISAFGKVLNLKCLIMKGCELGRPGARNIAAILESGLKL